jgi:hypothetical protein
MNSDSLTKLWNSPENRPTPGAGELLASDFIARLRRRRRFKALWLTWTACLLATATGLAVIHLTRRGLDGVNGQWALLPLLALPWMAMVYFTRTFLRQGAVPSEPAPSLHAALLAARKANAVECRHLRVVGWLFTAMIPVTAVAVWQLHGAGKVPGNQLWSMAFVFGTVFALGALGLIMRYRGQLLPEQRDLDARLQEFERV